MARIQPAATLSATLDGSSCLLLDGSAYTPYRLDLPVRGQIRMDLSPLTGDLMLILRDESGAQLDSGTTIRRPIEAGSYTVLVSGTSPGQVGGYKVTTGFTPEPAMLCANFQGIGKRQSVSGTLGAYGCVAPDGTPYDGYSLTTTGSGTLTIAASSQDFTPTVTLRDTDGHAIATSVGGMLVTPVLGDSQYVIVVASADRSGAYQISLSFQNATDDTCRARTSYTDAGGESGVIDATSCYVTIPGSGDQLYYNYYAFTLVAPAVVTLTAGSGDFTPTIYLLDESANTLAVDSVGGGYDTDGNGHSHLRIRLPAGNYLAQIFSDVAAGGKYQFQYTPKTADPAPCKAIPANAGDTVTGALSTASCRTALGLSDLYSLVLPASGTIEMDLGSMDFNTVLGIRDSKDNLILRNQEVDGVSTAHITADLPAGTYTVVAAANSNSGKYQLTSKFTAHDLAPCQYVQALNLNGGYVWRLSTASCKAANGQPVDYYGFTLSADSLALAVVTSSEVNGYLTLYDSSGQVVRRDRNSYSGQDPLIIQYLPAGTYKLGVRDQAASLGGLYEIDLRTVSGPRPAFCTSRGSLSLNTPVNGNLNYTGCQYIDATFADFYQLTLAADTTVDLRMTSTAFDAYLLVMDAKGNVIDEDDDSGGGVNARITRTMAAGTYYVIAKPFGDYRSAGAYTLSASPVQQ